MDAMDELIEATCVVMLAWNEWMAARMAALSDAGAETGWLVVEGMTLLLLVVLIWLEVVKVLVGLDVLWANGKQSAIVF